MEQVKQIYPFPAIVGQDQMKKALILNVINPQLGGVLIRGEKGTAKSTAVRALAALLPERDEVADCIFHCDPADFAKMCGSCKERALRGDILPRSAGRMRVVELPVSATEDRVVGTLDMEEAIKKGEKRFEPGILAGANRNILYVDEVNLLDDHVVDVLLDAAAMGVNTVEREGVSYSHPANFILVGTMNPEEGDLRPQLIDRFGLAVDVAGETDIPLRMEVIRRRLEFEQSPERFLRSWSESQSELCGRVEDSKRLLPEVIYDERILELAATISIEMEVDGHRADLGMIKTAMTLAAWNQRTRVAVEDILEASRLVLPHRMRRKPFDDGQMDFARVEEIVQRFRSGESG